MIVYNCGSTHLSIVPVRQCSQVEGNVLMVILDRKVFGKFGPQS